MDHSKNSPSVNFIRDIILSHPDFSNISPKINPRKSAKNPLKNKKIHNFLSPINKKNPLNIRKNPRIIKKISSASNKIQKKKIKILYFL